MNQYVLKSSLLSNSITGEFRKVVLRWTIRFFEFFWNFPGGCKKSFFRKMAPTATFFKYIPSKKKIQVTLIFFSKNSAKQGKKVSLDDFLLNLSRKNSHSSLLSAALRKIMCLKFTRLYSFCDTRASSRQEMKFPSIKLQAANERFLPFSSIFFCRFCTFWVFLNKSEVIFRILFHSEILKFLPQKAFQNGGGR